ncbi:hypothetical protein ACJ73_02107 [Blastomyces percursus]|uniref:Uncharacterized protein n=1 Tax=Blastomyces percursus TaxID=1658174 RepID=A0A1J9QDH3_9EURO|nr:hypothetical protein ACJ73_02107 [Blastomyces percursus]
MTEFCVPMEGDEKALEEFEHASCSGDFPRVHLKFAADATDICPQFDYWVPDYMRPSLEEFCKQKPHLIGIVGHRRTVWDPLTRLGSEIGARAIANSYVEFLNKQAYNVWRVDMVEYLRSLGAKVDMRWEWKKCGFVYELRSLAVSSTTEVSVGVNIQAETTHNLQPTSNSHPPTAGPRVKKPKTKSSSRKKKQLQNPYPPLTRHPEVGSQAGWGGQVRERSLATATAQEDRW